MMTPGDCSPGVSLFSYKSSLCTLGRVQEREFWQLLEEVLGRSYGRSLARDQVLDRLGGMTVDLQERMLWPYGEATIRHSRQKE